VDAGLERSLDELPHEERTETGALELVGNAHAQLGPGRVLLDVLSAADHTIPATREGEQRQVIRVLLAHGLRSDVRDVDRGRPESETTGLVREPDEVILDGCSIRDPCRSHVHRPAIAEDHVPLEAPRDLTIGHQREPIPKGCVEGMPSNSVPRMGKRPRAS
jgi:hypothetical protein